MVHQQWAASAAGSFLGGLLGAERRHGEAVIDSGLSREPRAPGPIDREQRSDLHSSTRYCLTKLDKILTPGTIVIFDEFGDLSREFRALHDYVAIYRREFKALCSHDQFFTIAIEIV